MIANGGSKEIERHSHILRFKESCGASSVMIARAAQWNPSIFTNDGRFTKILPISLDINL